MLLLSNIMIGVTVPCDWWICSVYLCFYFPDSLAVHRGMKYDFRPTKSYPLSAAMTGTRCHFPCFPECFISVSICVRIYGFVSAKIKLFHSTMSVNSQTSHHSVPPLKWKPERTIHSPLIIPFDIQIVFKVYLNSLVINRATLFENVNSWNIRLSGKICFISS